MIKGIDTFNPERGTRLATYAGRCIENEMLMHLRVIKRRRSEVSIWDPIGYDREGNEITLMDVLGSEPNVILDQMVAREQGAPRAAAQGAQGFGAEVRAQAGTTA